MANPFDQFDEDEGNPFDRFDQTPDTSAARGFGLGITQAIDGASRLINAIPGVGNALDAGSRALGLPTTQEAIKSNRDARANNTRTGWQLAGNVAGTLPLAALPGSPVANAVSRIPRVGGALAGAMSGVAGQGAAGGAVLSEADDLTGVVGDAAMGAVSSRLTQGALNRIGGAVAPRLAPNVQRLVDEGIPLTPGQASGGFIRTMEEAATAIPGVRDVVAAARDRGTEQFNRVVINRALKNIGVQLPDDLPVGREAVGFAADRVSDAYERLMPRLQLKPDKPFLNTLQRLEKQAADLPGDGLKAFRNAIGDDVLGMLRQGQTLAGDGLKTLESRLSSRATLLKRGDAYQQMVGETVEGLLGELRNALMRSNPAARQELKAVNRAFAEMVRVERAAGAAGSTTGVFTPKAYQAAVKASDASKRGAAFARGRAMNQQLSDAAADILPNRLPDSGTITRGIPAALAATAGAGGMAAALPGIAMAGAAALPYTGMGQRAVNFMLQNPGPTRRMIGGGIRRAGMAAPYLVPPLLAAPR